jgi:RNA polymerase sigma-70 factor (ECF subfamily)
MKTNTELIDGMREGSQRAYTTMYNLYSRMVCATIFGIVKNRDIADDLTSEVFMKIFNNIASFKKDVSLQLWVKTIAVNHSIDYIRRTANKRDMLYIDDEMASDFVITDLSNPETDMIKKEDSGVARIGLDAYGGNMGIAMRLRFDEGLKYRQIAERLGISIGTVKHYLYRAKERVKKEVENQD